jgi:hypothetical protein
MSPILELRSRLLSGVFLTKVSGHDGANIQQTSLTAANSCSTRQYPFQLLIFIFPFPILLAIQGNSCLSLISPLSEPDGCNYDVQLTGGYVEHLAFVEKNVGS